MGVLRNLLGKKSFGNRKGKVLSFKLLTRGLKIEGAKKKIKPLKGSML